MKNRDQAEQLTQLRSPLIWQSRSHSTHLKKPSSFNSAEKAVSIQPSWKSRPHSTQLKQPSSFNPAEKAVPI
jgi:hypothetical protein